MSISVQTWSTHAKARFISGSAKHFPNLSNMKIGASSRLPDDGLEWMLLGDGGLDGGLDGEAQAELNRVVNELDTLMRRFNWAYDACSTTIASNDFMEYQTKMASISPRAGALLNLRDDPQAFFEGIDELRNNIVAQTTEFERFSAIPQFLAEFEKIDWFLQNVDVGIPGISQVERSSRDRVERFRDIYEDTREIWIDLREQLSQATQMVTRFTIIQFNARIERVDEAYKAYITTITSNDLVDYQTKMESIRSHSEALLNLRDDPQAFREGLDELRNNIVTQKKAFELLSAIPQFATEFENLDQFVQNIDVSIPDMRRYKSTFTARVEDFRAIYTETRETRELYRGLREELSEAEKIVGRLATNRQRREHA